MAEIMYSTESAENLPLVKVSGFDTAVCWE